MRRTLAALLTGLVLPLSALAQDAPGTGVLDDAAEAGVVAFDAVVLRPLAALHLAVGAILFVPTALPSAFSEPDAIQRAKEIFIDMPKEQLLDRPLGEL